MAARPPTGRRRGSGDTMIQRSRAVSPLTKASYVIDGRAPRDFFGLTTTDEQAISDRIEAALDEAFKET